MPKSITERIAESKARTAQLEQQRREEIRREREKEKKINQRRNYIVGELVCEYFPILKKLTPGTKAQNKITFKAFEIFLSKLASNEKILCEVNAISDKNESFHGSKN